MTDEQDTLNRLNRSLRLGRTIDRAFARECERRNLNPEFASLAPIASIVTSTQEKNR
jgi:hypothetical protein